MAEIGKTKQSKTFFHFLAILALAVFGLAFSVGSAEASGDLTILTSGGNSYNM